MIIYDQCLLSGFVYLSNRPLEVLNQLIGNTILKAISQRTAWTVHWLTELIDYLTNALRNSTLL